MKSFLVKKNTGSFLLLCSISFIILTALILRNTPKLENIQKNTYDEYSWWIFFSGYATFLLLYSVFTIVILERNQLKVDRSTRLFPVVLLVSSVLSMLSLSYIPIYSKDSVSHFLVSLDPNL